MAYLTGTIFPFVLIRVRNRPLLTACFLLAAVLTVTNYFLWEKRDAVALRHEEVKKKGEFMLESLVKRTDIDADLNALQGAMVQIGDNLIDEASMEVNLGYFYRLERVARVRLVRLNQLAALPANGSAFKSVPFSMQVSGSFRNAMNFLRALETGPRVLRIRQCNFERAANATGGDLTLDLTLDVLTKA